MRRGDGSDRVWIEQVPDHVWIHSNRVLEGCTCSGAIAMDLKRAQGPSVRPRRLAVAVVLGEQPIGFDLVTMFEQRR